MENGNTRENGEWSRMRPHEHFLELCAISTTGELSADEQRQLQEHVATCSECRRALEEFEAVAAVGAPLLASELAESRHSENDAESAEFISAHSAAHSHSAGSEAAASKSGPNTASVLPGRNGHHWSETNWNYLWASLAAAVVLIVALGIYSYRAGRHSGAQVAQTDVTATADTRVDALEQKLSDAGHERELLRTQLADRDGLIRKLQHQVESQSAALNAAETAEAALQRSVESDQQEKQQIAQQQNDLRQKLEVAEAALATTKADLDSAQHQRRQEQLAGQSLGEQIKDLNAQLRSSEQRIGKQEDLLAEDRDVRDLMGARDLYIAEVYDVARDGTTRKPYGRVFYTKGKSLIFYAYDLDEQPGVKTASTFQAWGQNGPDRQQAVSLGIFYQDSAAKKRWVLKTDNPEKLEQISAVFVTMEPPGGSHRPDGKSLLFASLRIEPNHP
jgi:putative zinc finger protein